jgi:hypothetical protein
MLTIDPPEKIANWRPLVQWLLAIPHLAVMYALNILGEILAVISWFAILFTGRLPASIAGMQCMILRYGARLQTYLVFMVDEYPPFAFGTATADPGERPRVRVDVVPALEDRNRLTSFFRLILAIPHFIAMAVLALAAVVCVLIAVFAVLFTGRWPEGLRAFVIHVARWGLRVQAYCFLLTDEYPPFALD